MLSHWRESWELLKKNALFWTTHSFDTQTFQELEPVRMRIVSVGSDLNLECLLSSFLFFFIPPDIKSYISIPKPQSSALSIQLIAQILFHKKVSCFLNCWKKNTFSNIFVQRLQNKRRYSKKNPNPNDTSVFTLWSWKLQGCALLSRVAVWALKS